MNVPVILSPEQAKDLLHAAEQLNIEVAATKHGSNQYAYTVSLLDSVHVQLLVASLQKSSVTELRLLANKVHVMSDERFLSGRPSMKRAVARL